MLVTTSYDPSEAMIAQAQDIANELGGRWVPRKRESLTRLRKLYKIERLIVVTEQEIRYIDGDASPLFFHPSIALVRVKRLLKGEQDAMLAASKAERGDTVLDCTAGLASDSIVFSYQTGASGQVIALESEVVTAMLIRRGLRSYLSEVEPLNEAMRRVQVVHAHHLAYMQGLPNHSVDIVYFDPMFRKPVDDSAWISPLRQTANEEPLSIAAIVEARRIARKAVVMKELRDSGEFERLGFQIVSGANSKVTYGVITC